MAQKRLSMRKIAEILRLKHQAGLSDRQIAHSCGVGHPTVGKYLSLASAAGLSWPLPEGMDEAGLHERLFPSSADAVVPARALPDMAHIHQELRRPHVTLQLLWEEYRRSHADGYGYTQFCEYYKRWKAPLCVTLRQQHVAGEKTFLDWAGKTAWWVDADTGERHPGYLFVGVLGASDYVFAVACPNQQLSCWIDAHIQMVEYLGGVTRLWVPDNAKTGVVKACYYEPQIHRTYQELADHYEVAILPTRTQAPRDKAKVENAVLMAERRILARLRDDTFFSVGELNDGIRRCLAEINQRPMQKLGVSRQQLFEELDQPLLRPLPAYRYELGSWRQGKANIDYHVQVDKHFYSVPYTLTQQTVDIRLSARTVEICHRGRRVALHVRSDKRGGFTTDPSHRPKSHQKHLEWTPQRLIDWGATIGPYGAQLVRQIMASRPHPQQGYRSCLGLMRLGRAYPHERVEAACHRALVLDVANYISVKNILKANIDQQPLPEEVEHEPAAVVAHANIRGQDYYRRCAAAPASAQEEDTSC